MSSSLRSAELQELFRGARLRLADLDAESTAELRAAAGEAALAQLERRGRKASAHLPAGLQRSFVQRAGAEAWRTLQRGGVVALDESARETLRGLLADQRMAELAKLAGRDGVIEGDEAGALFQWLDGLDANGRADSLALTQPSQMGGTSGVARGLAQPASEGATFAGRVVKRLFEHVERDHAITERDFVAAYKHGWFDPAKLATLGAEERALLQRTGIFARLQARLAEGRPEPLTTAQLRAIWRDVDRVDTNGSSDSVNVRSGGGGFQDLPFDLEVRVPERTSEAGRVIAALNRVFVSAATSDARRDGAEEASSRPTDLPPASPNDAVDPLADVQAGSLWMSPRVDRDTFAQSMRDTVIDLAALERDPAALDALRDIGLSLERLRGIAAKGKGGSAELIGGPNAEMSLLFAELQRLDGARGALSPWGADGMRLGKAGRALALLERFTERHTLITRETLTAELTGGKLDFSRLDEPVDPAVAGSPTLRQRLTELGFPATELEHWAKGSRGRTRGEQAAPRVFELLRAMSPPGLRPGTISLASSRDGEQAATPAGEALELVTQRLITGYDQRPIRRYGLEGTLQYAPGDARPRDISIPVTHNWMRRKDDCLRRARDTVRSVPGASIEQDGNGHWMARSEARGGGAIAADKKDLEAGRAYIDWALERGVPVAVGVSRGGGSNGGGANRDGITDHFVVIVGREVDAEGRLRYRYLDPATHDVSRAVGYFYVDARTSLLFAPVNKSAPVEIAKQGYQVSHVRAFTSLPRSAGPLGKPAQHFADVTGVPMRAPGAA